jgi:hypothetical protein
MSEQDKLIDEMEYYQDELKGQGDSESSLNDLLPCPFCGGPADEAIEGAVDDAFNEVAGVGVVAAEFQRPEVR